MVSASAQPEEAGVLRQPQTEAYLGARSLGTGTLVISPSQLSWKEDARQIGFSLFYPNISLHAIRREPFPSLYLMLDHKLELPEGLALPEEPANANRNPDNDDEDSGEEEEEDDEEACPTELMFAPADQDALQRLFDAMSECQALHPDPNDSFSEEDEDIYEDASDIMDENGEDQQQYQDPAEDMEALNIDPNNHPSNNGSNNGADEMDCDPEEYADA